MNLFGACNSITGLFKKVVDLCNQIDDIVNRVMDAECRERTGKSLNQLYADGRVKIYRTDNSRYLLQMQLDIDNEAVFRVKVFPSEDRQQILVKAERVVNI